MSERLPASSDDQRIPEDDLQSLIGRTIVRAEQVERDTGGDWSYGRTDSLKLTLDDGRTATIGHWASYADDSGLDLELDGPRPPTGDEEGLAHPCAIFARLDRTRSHLDEAQRQLPLSGVGTYGPAMQKIGDAQHEVHRLCGEQFKKLVGS